MATPQQKQDEKLKRKLRPFFDKNAGLGKRWKSLTSYNEKAGVEDLNKFFNENFYMIYGVFLDTFSAYENNCKKGRHSASEVTDVMEVLRNVLIHLSELIRKKWQTRSIAAVLEKLLYKENKINVRVSGFGLLLIFLEAVQTLETSQIELFASSIDLTVFAVGANQGARFRRVALSAPDKTSVLVPSNTAGLPENSVKLWEDMLDYVTNKPGVFGFWIDHLKKQYFSIFYPEVSKRVGIVDDDFGFPACCPHPIQRVNISRLAQWMNNEQISSILWSSEENIQLMLEMFSQSCKLPIAYADTIKEAINLFQNLFLGAAKLPPEIEARHVEFRQFFFQQLPNIFNINPEDKPQEHLALCQEIVQRFKAIFFEKYASFAVETQECMLHILLATTIDVCKNHKKFDISLVKAMLDTVFLLWIRTKRNTDEMWLALQNGIDSIFHFMEPIIQTQLKLIQLTLTIKTMLYPERKVKKKPPAKTPEGGEVPAKKFSQSICPDSRAPLPEYPADPNITGINWDSEEVIFVWNQVLQVFRNVNQIKDPQLHAEAIKVLCEVIEILLRAEEDIPYQEPVHQPLCLINIFGHWLFEACYLPESFLTGKSYAVGTLCRLVVRHYGDLLPLEFLSHFYAIIHHCLKSHPNSIVSHSILTNSNNIFNLALPGCNILIPHYIQEIKRAIKAPNKDVRLKSILITNSLICYPNHLDSLTCPSEFSSKSADYDLGASLKKEIVQILIEYVNCDTEVPEHRVSAIWGMCCTVFEELNNTPNHAMIKDIIRTLLPCCMSAEALVARAALDSISTLTLVYEELRALDESIINIIADILSANILRQLLEAKQSKTYQLNESLVADHFYCLLDWVMSSPGYLFDKKAIASKVFEAIEIGLLGQKLQVEGPVQVDKKKIKRASVKEQPGSVESQLTDLLENLIQKPVHNSLVIKEAAHILLVQLCNFLQNFPCGEGIEIMSSQITESDDIFKDQIPLFYIYNDFALFSLVEVPQTDGSHMARIILRDCTGKYAWDARINYKNYIHEVPLPFCLLKKPILPPPEPDPVVVSQSVREPRVPPKSTPESGPTVDQLEDLLQYLGETFPDCLPENGAPLNRPSDTRSEYKSSIEAFEVRLLEQRKKDSTTVEFLQANLPPYQDWAFLPSQPPVPESPLHHCRLFLNHMGFLSYDKQAAFSMVDFSPRFQRSLQQLDKTSGREMLKIGVIYVKEGQDDQKIILRNDTKSELYAEFVRGLGWPIDIASHRGYLGGLDPKLTTGVTAPYYANSIMEVIFHEITSMPTNPSDNQQIHKKRHVGNDIVHIVYSENTGDYLPTTITSQFNDAHIIVYPLPNGLYRIQIYRKDNVQLFGPLIHGMCISKRLLAPLVRQTAINANRYVRYNTGGYSRPFPTRRRALDEIVERFKQARPYEEMVNELFSPTKPVAAQPSVSAPGTPQQA